MGIIRDMRGRIDELESRLREMDERIDTVDERIDDLPEPGKPEQDGWARPIMWGMVAIALGLVFMGRP